MRIIIGAVGRMKPGPERSLTDDYVRRFARTGRPIGLGPIEIREVDERKAATPAAQAAALEKLISKQARVTALDERGAPWSSRELAENLRAWRDNGQEDALFLIGGAEGLDPALRDRASNCLSLGNMVWPHMLARVMLTEQLYRAATILAGTPYHRD